MLIGWLFHLWAFTPDEPFPESAALPGVDGTVVAAVGIYYLALLALAVPLTSKEQGESGGADHGDLEQE